MRSREFALPDGGSYRLRHSARARHLRIEVRPESLLVVVPRGVSETHAHGLVARRMPWIVATRARLLARSASKAPAPEWVSGKSAVLWRGQTLSIVVRLGDPPGVIAGRDSATVQLRLPAGLTPTEALARQRQLLREWLQEEAAVQARRSLAVLVERTGLFPSGLRLAEQCSRWGSCGIHGRVHLNWRVVMAPVAVFDYVLVHELCHLRERNHSARFWALVETHCPDWRTHRNWLRRQGAWLMAALRD
jgi:predicted metal-dependent hydrolase